ncbi:MATE family efflux transporter [Clostridium sp. MB40-C1]|uniref:MATE family efflux transporter n=1 Tax=Clostridium sp. MB40-C1 TaxID=3070996 RepID=UPI0027E1C177|nr:MATE family efflux transporter [Clostridium sp. MB40-C1]WMJ80572.1 MATE family efflux transporter [Clostridium sp. MB40-C1]
MNKREELLSQGNINNSLLKLALPATIAMLVNALYNIVDTIFIGRGVGTLGIAGIAIQLPIQIIILSFSLLIGIGSASMISRNLGKKDLEKVNYIAGNSFFCVGILGIIFSILGYTFTSPIVKFFGTTDNIFPYARDYTRIMFIGSLYFPFCVSCNNIIRSEGNAKDAMISMIIGFLSNILLDYIFIFKLYMGIKGAAIATILSKLGSFIYILIYLKSNRTSLKIAPKYFIPEKNIIKEMISIGFSGFAVQVSGSIVTIFLNHILGLYGGDLAIAVYGIIYKITLLLFMPINGIIQGMQPIVGYNFGCNNISKIKETIRLVIIYTTIITTIGVILVELFPSGIIKLFNSDPYLLSHGVKALRIVIVATPLLGIQMTGLGLSQSLGEALTSFILSILRQVILFIPIVLILPNIYNPKINGVWLSFPIADLISVIITLPILKKQLQKLNISYNLNLKNKF